MAFTVKLKKEIHRNLGAYMTPQVALHANAWTRDNGFALFKSY